MGSWYLDLYNHSISGNSKCAGRMLVPCYVGSLKKVGRVDQPTHPTKNNSHSRPALLIVDFRKLPRYTAYSVDCYYIIAYSSTFVFV